MMKLGLSLLLALWGMHAFADVTSTAQIDEAAPIEERLEGTWEIQNRYCYSGAPVRDAFVPGRDTMELTFRKTEFRSFSDVQGCVGYSAGDYEVRGGRITMFIHKQISTCSRDRFVGSATYPFDLRAGRLTVSIGPVGYGGPCPQGDTLAVVYRRF